MLDHFLKGESMLFLRHEARSASGPGTEIVVVAVSRPFAAAAAQQSKSEAERDQKH